MHGKMLARQNASQPGYSEPTQAMCCWLQCCVICMVLPPCTWAMPTAFCLNLLGVSLGRKPRCLVSTMICKSGQMHQL